MSSNNLHDGWYFRSGPETVGPVSTAELRELLSSGRVAPRQAVWQRRPQACLFVHAATAACDNPWREAS